MGNNHNHNLNGSNNMNNNQRVFEGSNIIQTVNVNNHINHIHHSSYNEHNIHQIIMNGNGSYDKNMKSQIDNFVSFMKKYREMIRSQNKFDMVWFQNGLN